MGNLLILSDAGGTFLASAADPFLSLYVEVDGSSLFSAGRSVEAREANAKGLLAQLRIPYLDTYVSTAYRPGGRMPGINWYGHCLDSHTAE